MVDRIKVVVCSCRYFYKTVLFLILNLSQIYENKRAFNVKILELREQKVQLVERMKQIGERLAEIRVEIPHKLAKSPPMIPEIDDELEFPEKNVEVCNTTYVPNMFTV